MVKSGNSQYGRMSFSCPHSLKDKIREVSEKEGISMSSKIVELLNLALSMENNYADSGSDDVLRLDNKIAHLEEEIIEQKRINAIFEEKIDLLRYEMARLNSFKEISNSNLN